MTTDTQTQQTADVERILALHKAGKSVREIADTPGIGAKKSRVHSIIRQASTQEESMESEGRVLSYVGPDSVDDNPYQVRESRDPARYRQLVESIESIGLQNVPTVRRVGDRFQIAQGHGRRDVVRDLMAAGKWDLPGLPVDVREYTDTEMALVAAAENSAREDVSRIQEIKGWRRMLEAIPELTATDLVPHVGLDRSTIQNYMALLRLPDPVLDLIDDGTIPRRAARELFALENEKESKSRPDMMSLAIELIRSEGVDMEMAPKYTGDRIREAIVDVVADHEDWRPLDDPPPGDRTMWSLNGQYNIVPAFKIEAFVKEHPASVFTLPAGAEFKESRRWTDNGDAWDESQRQALAAADAGAKGKGSSSSTRSRSVAPAPEKAAGRSEKYDQLIRSDPVVLAAAGDPDAWAKAAAKHAKTLKPKKPADESVPGQVAYHRLHTELAEMLRTVPADREGWAVIEDHAQLIHDELKLSELDLSYTQSRNAVARYVMEAIKAVDIAVAGKITKLTDEHRAAAGTRVLPLLLGSRHTGFIRYVGRAGGHQGIAHYFENPRECRMTCTNGAQYGQQYQGQDVELVCTNEECFSRKLAAGKATHEAALEIKHQEDAAEDEVLVAALLSSMTPQAARVVGAAQIGATERYSLVQPDGDREFAYQPENISRLKQVLALGDVEIGESGNIVLGGGMFDRETAIAALWNTADDDKAREAAARLVVHAGRFRLADGAAALLRLMNPEQPKRRRPRRADSASDVDEARTVLDVEPESATSLHSHEPEEHAGMIRLEYAGEYQEGQQGPRFVYLAPAWVEQIRRAGSVAHLVWTEPGRDKGHQSNATIMAESADRLQPLLDELDRLRGEG